jgi:glycolate dehydrogenase FAD-binding subunit
MREAAVALEPDFASIVGEANDSAEPEVCALLAVDGVTPKRALYPSTAEQVAEVLKVCSESGLAVIPCGNGTKLALGNAPRRYDVALCLKEMKRVPYFEPDDLVIGVEPGLKFTELQSLLAERRLSVPLDPEARDRATIGGILGANSAGPLRLRYGGARDMVLGMKIATARGKIVKTGGRVVKNVAGYDLGKLLIGSCGTLGVIVEATLKLYPQEQQRATWAIELETLAGARELRRSLLASPLRPQRAVLMNRHARAIVGASLAGARTGPGPLILVEAGGSERVMARYETGLGMLAAAHRAPISRMEGEAAMGVWARVADFASRFAGERPTGVLLRAALPIAAAEQFLERAGKDLEGFEAAGIAQMGVGIVEVGFVSPDASSGGETARLRPIETLRQSAANFGGCLVVTRMPASMKEGLDVWGPPGDDFEVMRKLKAALDPNAILAPGRFVGRL